MLLHQNQDDPKHQLKE